MGWFERQLGHPRGLIGRWVSRRMGRLNGPLCDAALAAIDWTGGDRSEPAQVLDAGFGSVASLRRLARRFPGARVVGVDRSALVVAVAQRELARDRTLARKVEVLQAELETLPHLAASFDLVVSVNTVYFWADPVRIAVELARVLKRRGELVLAFVEPRGAVATAAADFTPRRRAEVIEWVAAAGLGLYGSWTEETSRSTRCVLRFGRA